MCTISGDLFVTGKTYAITRSDNTHTPTTLPQNITHTGGLNASGSLRSVERYSPSSDTWVPNAPMPYARFAHCACVVEGRMCVLGGYGRNKRMLRSVLMHDTSSGIWSEVAQMPAPRFNFGACVVGTDVYVCGGQQEQSTAVGVSHALTSSRLPRFNLFSLLSRSHLTFHRTTQRTPTHLTRLYNVFDFTCSAYGLKQNTLH